MDRVINGEAIIPGQASGVALASTEPVSFWGGYDQSSARLLTGATHYRDRLLPAAYWCCPIRAGRVHLPPSFSNP